MLSSSNTDHTLQYLLREYVHRYSGIVDIQFDPSIDPPLPIDPRSRSREGKRKAAHYFLLVASIDEGNVVGRAENARVIVAGLYERFEDKVFELDDERPIMDYLSSVKRLRMGRLWRLIPRILASVNQYVSGIGGDLVEYAESFGKPAELADSISTSIYRMGKTTSSARKKTWMYMRWMVRPYPDLRVFENFHPRDLLVPLDRNTGRVYYSLGVINSLEEIGYREVLEATRYARTLFPDDPARTDYPFFLLGRTLRIHNLPLNTEGLRHAIALMKTRS